MENHMIGEQITRYRKALNMTQEELGKAVGVSTQAVSRWENGGTPDVALLPAIADKLGVTIDALFGREGGQRLDIHETVAQWLAGVPIKERFDQLCRLNWTALKNMIAGKGKFPEISYLENCEMRNEEPDRADLATAQVWLEGGFMLDVHAENMSFSSIWPRPEKGYEAYFASMDQYRTLFAVLSRPGCLELLEYLNSQTSRLYVPEALAAALRMPLQEVETILQELLALHVMHKKELQLADGLTSAYTLFQGTTLVPFLYMARCMMQYGQNLVVVGDGDAAPLLDGGGQNDKKEKKDEKK